MPLPISLTAAAVAALLNIWLGWRVGQVRLSEKVSLGDGGNQRVVCRMRAHANFTEYTPFVLILIALLELAGANQTALWAVMAIYMLARIAHALGMDADSPGQLRRIGTIVTMVTLLGLAGYAVYTTQTVAAAPTTITPMQDIEDIPAG